MSVVCKSRETKADWHIRNNNQLKLVPVSRKSGSGRSEGWWWGEVGVNALFTSVSIFCLVSILIETWETQLIFVAIHDSEHSNEYSFIWSSQYSVRWGNSNQLLSHSKPSQTSLASNSKHFFNSRLSQQQRLEQLGLVFMVFGPCFLRSFPGKLWVSRHWVCSWGPGSCQLGSPGSQLMGTFWFSTYCLSSQKASPGLFPGKSKRARARAVR